jgi:hypothetical protein
LFIAGIGIDQPVIPVPGKGRDRQRLDDGAQKIAVGGRLHWHAGRAAMAPRWPLLHLEQAKHVDPLVRQRKALDPHTVVGSTRGIETQRALFAAEHQRAPLLVLAVLFFRAVEQLAAAAADEVGDVFREEVGIGLVDRDIAQFAVLDIGRVVQIRDPAACQFEKVPVCCQKHAPQ